MKKWLIRCLTVLAMVCLIPGIALNAKAVANAFTYCIQCKADKTCDILGYVWQSNADPIYHKIRIKCRTCRTENEIIYKPFSYHTGGTETPTCTTGKICRLCWSEYGILGHAWGEWSSAGNGTHIRSCTRSNCDAVDTASCTGGTATCSAKAVCVTCGAEYGEKDSNNHALEQHAAKAPTCTEIGWDAYDTCSRCDYTTYAELPALKHALEQYAAKAPTCTEIGWDTYDRCIRCGYTTRKELPAQHDLEQHAAKAPTCTEKGWNAYETCSRCDYTTYVEQPALNHDLVQHAAKAPTCTEIGWNAYETCSRFGCNYTTRKELPALKHDFVYYKAKDPTCTEPGCDAYETCSRCDYTTYVERPALKHDLRQRVIKAPTCTGEGWAHVACSRCDYFTSLVLSALNHDLEQHAAQAPTCMEKGWNAYETCSRCDYTTYVELPAQHDFVHHQAKAPTCTEIGWDAYETCSRCDYTTRKELPALNHDLVQHAAKAPTCTEIGWNAYEACSRFGCDYTTRKELPALNHDLEQHAAKAPTCTEIGWDAYETCSRCDYTTYAELPALNHDYQAVTVEPTCETDGYTIFTCSRCKDSYTADPTDQLGHKFGAWSPNGTGSQSADCLRQGCAHTGSTDCRKFTFRTAEGETLTFCPVCGQAENAAQLEKIEAATAWANSGSLSAEDVTARTNGEYLSVAFETAGSLTQPTGRVRLALPAGLLEGKTLVRIAPDGTQTEMPFETERGTIILTLDFANSELPVMLFRLVPQPTAL